MEQWLRVELHCHTIYSKDSLTTVEALLETAQRLGIDRVAITDHNSIAGALAARKLDAERVIVGEEIRTTEGELLAYFLQEEIPPYLSPVETIARLKAQGAFISVPHPFDLRRSGWQPADLLEIIPHVDAIEVFNSRCMLARFNEQAAGLAREHNLPATVGSDAHTLMELGRSTLRLPEFCNAEELRGVIRQGKAETRLSPFWVNASSMGAKIYKRLLARRMPAGAS